MANGSYLEVLREILRQQLIEARKVGYWNGVVHTIVWSIIGVLSVLVGIRLILFTYFAL